ncbi:MAG TPA: hypothetical protein VFM89_06550 [Casimicrobiaceae bacterium]|nr:hypothetical protein [Casimicrobiaceae bacterium]
MKPRQWMQVAAVASALGLAGTANANDIVTSSARSTIGNESAASVIDQATPPSNGNAAADLNNSPSTDVNGSAIGSGSMDLNDNAAADLNGSVSTDANVNGTASDASNGSRAPSDLSNGVSSSATAPAATSGSDESSYGNNATSAAQGDRVTRQEFLDEMGRRFDALDTRHQGSLTPYEIDEILVVTAPANASSAPSGTSSRQSALQGDTWSAPGIDNSSDASSSSSLDRTSLSATLGNSSDTAPSSSMNGGTSSIGTSGASDDSSSSPSISR